LSIIFIDLDLVIHNKYSLPNKNVEPVEKPLTSPVLVSKIKTMIIILEALIAYQCRMT